MSDIDFEAVLTKEQVGEIEQRFQGADGVARRTTLMTLTKSKAELSEGLADMDAGAVEYWVEQVVHFQSQLDSLKEMADAALARLVVASGVGVEQA